MIYWYVSIVPGLANKPLSDRCSNQRLCNALECTLQSQGVKVIAPWDRGLRLALRRILKPFSTVKVIAPWDRGLRHALVERWRRALEVKVIAPWDRGLRHHFPSSLILLVLGESHCPVGQGI